MPQRDRAPQEEWVERKDRDTRRAFERFEEKLRKEFEDELAGLRSDTERRFKTMEEHLVSWKGFAVFIVPLVAALLSLVGVFMAPVKEKVDRVETAVTKRLDGQDSKLDKQDARLERVGTDLNAVMRVTVDGKPRKQAQREWESATGVPRIDAAP